YVWLKTSLTNNAPYNQLAYAILASQSSDTTMNESSAAKGELHFLAFAYQQVNGIPRQDTVDMQAANTARTFLGISRVDCLLCHNGAGHLTTLSLWAGKLSRYQAWQFASFMSHTNTSQFQTPVPYFSVVNSSNADYTLGTATGNRPARTAASTPTGRNTVAPAYMWGGQTPNQGEDYRVALGRLVTNDFQFARAA